MAKLTSKQWDEIRADYEIENIGIRELERKYKIASSTIATRMKKENWQASKYEQKITNVVSTIEKINEQANDAERARIAPKFDNAIELLKHMNNFVSLGAKINVDVLNALDNEPDLKTKVMGLSALKATMPELAKLAGIQKELEPSQPQEKSEIPDNPIDASIAYQELIKK